MKFNALLTFLFFSVSAFSSEEIIKKKFYTLNYNEDHEVANWVSYELDQARLQNCVKRKNSFRPDPAVSTGSSSDEDYRGSGFDRGHLVPAGDMKFSAEAMKDTFFFSNMTPQPPKFNQGQWGKLENLIRSWGAKYGKIWIVSGPILRDNLPFIGKKNRVSVPEEYFKVIIRQNGSSFEGIGFVMGTDVPHRNLDQYVKTIDEVEELSSFDFFKNIPRAQEERVERTVNKRNWDFTGKFEYFPCQTSVAQ
jgi:endonuclease G